MVTVRNEGSRKKTHLTLKNTIPTEAIFISASGPTKYTSSGGKIHFAPVKELKPGEKLVYKIVCKVIAAGSAKNRALLKNGSDGVTILDEEGTSCYK